MQKKELSKLLKNERDKRGMSKKEFAALLGISERSLSSYESGERRPELNSLEKILKKLGYELEIRKA